MRKVGIRALIVLAVIVGYFTVLRPLRAVVNESILKPAIHHVADNNTHLELTDDASSVSNLLLIDSGGQFYFKVPFGLNFLLAVIGLVLISAKPSFYGYLLLIQIIGVIFAFLSFYLGGVVSLKLVILSDLMVRYLIPLCSLGVVPVAYIFKAQKLHEREA